MEWINLTSASQLEEIKTNNGFSVIFKHSTRCSVSMFAKRSFESEWDVLPSDTKLYFLDLLAYRDLSSQIADMFQVHHESPQALLITQGECILDQSHSDISADEIAEAIKK